MTKLLEALATLPPALATGYRTLYLEATGPEAMVFAANYVGRAQAAKTAAWEFGQHYGAIGYYPPRSDHQPRHCAAFVFKDKPAGAAWRKAGRGHDTRGKGDAYYPSKHKDGKALWAEIEALPAFPGTGELIEAAGLLSDLKFRSHERAKQYGGADYSEWHASVGFGLGDGKLHFTVYGHIENRLFVLTPNPFCDIAAAANGWSDLEVVNDAMDWRPKEGWTLRSKAEVDLAYAQDAVGQEKKAA